MRKNLSITGALALTASLLLPVLGSTTGAGAESAFAYSIKSVDKESCMLVKVDLTTAAVTELGSAPSAGACVADLAVAADGTPWGIKQVETPMGPKGGASPQQTASGTELVKFDPATGNIVDTVGMSVNGNPDSFLAEGGIAIEADGTVYAQLVSNECDTGSSVCLVTVDPASGAATVIGSVGDREAYFWFLADCDGLVTSSRRDGQQFISVNDADGSTAVLSETGVTEGFDCAGAQRFALNEPLSKVGSVSSAQTLGLDLVTFDPTTGVTTFVASVDPEVSLETLAIPPVKQPPSTTTTTAATPTTTAPAVQAVTVQPKFTG